jgi:hypothetical protein
VSKKPADPAKAQKYLAQRQAEQDGRKKSPGPAKGDANLLKSFDARRRESGVDGLSAIDNLRLKYVSLLHEIGKEKFVQIDRILGLDPGMSRQWAEKHPKEYANWTKEHIDISLTDHYRHKISVLEQIIDGGLSSIRMWKTIQGDVSNDSKERAAAAKELREWYKLLMMSQQQGKLKSIIPEELQDAIAEAEELEKRLVGMLSSEMGPDEEN